jgi:hypothetical protein
MTQGAAGRGVRGARVSVAVDDQTRSVLEEIRRARGPAATLDDVAADALREYADEYKVHRQAAPQRPPRGNER